MNGMCGKITTYTMYYCIDFNIKKPPCWAVF